MTILLDFSNINLSSFLFNYLLNKYHKNTKRTKFALYIVLLKMQKKGERMEILKDKSLGTRNVTLYVPITLLNEIDKARTVSRNQYILEIVSNHFSETKNI